MDALDAVSKLKEDIEDKKEKCDRQEKSGTDELEEEFNNLVDHIITEQYLVIHWIRKIILNGLKYNLEDLLVCFLVNPDLLQFID